MNQTAPSKFGFALAALFFLSACDPGEDAPADDTSDTGDTGDTGAMMGCEADPWACPEGQTCWAVDQANTEFECLNSGPAEQGEECQNLPGSPTCADGLGCFSVAGYPTVCSHFCSNTDPDYACADAAVCLSFQSGSPSLCEPEMTEGDSTGEGSSTS